MRPVAGTLALLAALLAAPTATGQLLDESFDAGPGPFAYQDDTFRGTSEPAYADGLWEPAGGFEGGPGLVVALGGIDGNDRGGMSGGWQAGFTVPADGPYELTLRYRLMQSGDYESSELSQTMVALDGTTIGTGGALFVAEIKGDGNGGPERTTDWRVFRADLGTLTSGAHTLTIGGWNSFKTTASEFTEIRLDDVRIDTPVAVPPDLSVQAIVDDLDLARFEQNMVTLADFGTRFWSRQGNLDATDWIADELVSYGYVVERHAYQFSGQTRESVYATKLGTTRPDEMYIVSAHHDSFNTQSSQGSFAPGFDDDASGTSLVLEAARVFAPATVETDVSIRFILWNNEETGLDGSEAYVNDRRAQQGIESPLGSGQYPEPTWLGVLQHDMILFDHGLPVQPQQIPDADIDVEYQSGASFVGEAIELATAVAAANGRYALDYPAEVSADMNFTDSKSFQFDCPSISLRENRRVAEIGNGANPNWHKNSDVPSTYSAADILLGFNTVQTTVGAVATLAGARVVVCGDGIVPASEGCDDGDLVPGDGCDGSCQVEPSFTCAGEPSACAVCRPDALGFVDPTALTWSAPSPSICAARFDVARGELAALRTTGGLTSAICLVDDAVAPTASDPADPLPGEAWWYVSRVDGDSWDDGAGTASPTRDSSLTACP